MVPKVFAPGITSESGALFLGKKNAPHPPIWLLPSVTYVPGAMSTPTVKIPSLKDVRGPIGFGATVVVMGACRRVVVGGAEAWTVTVSYTVTVSVEALEALSSLHPVRRRSALTAVPTAVLFTGDTYQTEQFLGFISYRP